MQGYIYNDNNTSMYTYMIIYDYNIHIQYIVCEYRGFCSLNITVYNSKYIYIYIYTKFTNTIPDPRYDL